MPAAAGRLRFWRNTSVASLAAGKVATLTGNELTYEWDRIWTMAARPAGLIRLSSTTDSMPTVLQDYGSTYGTGTATHSYTLYRAASGALVFGAGTTRYAWALDNVHDVTLSSTPAADLRCSRQP